MEFKQTEKMNWQEEFKRMKRWIHRIDINTDSNREDFLLAFLQCCYHFHYWLEKDKIADKAELNKHISDYYVLKLCADICNFSKHGNSKRTPMLDPDTEVIGQKLMSMTPTGSSSMLSILKIKSQNKEIYDAFSVGKDCVDAWAQFLIKKGYALPIMPEEVIFLNYDKWEPKWSPEDPELYRTEQNKIKELIRNINDLEISLYKNPTNRELLERFKEFLVDIRRENSKHDVIDRVIRAIEKKVKIDSESTRHYVAIKKVIICGIEGNSAKVETLETSYWKWTDGQVFSQENKPHIFFF